MNMDTTTIYQVIDLRTGAVVAERASVARARRVADELDNQHGAVIHTVKKTTIERTTR